MLILGLSMEVGKDLNLLLPRGLFYALAFINLLFSRCHTVKVYHTSFPIIFSLCLSLSLQLCLLLGFYLSIDLRSLLDLFPCILACHAKCQLMSR